MKTFMQTIDAFVGLVRQRRVADKARVASAVRVALLAWLSAATLAAAAGTLQIDGMGLGPFALRVTSLQEARFQATKRQQYDFSCGSAAVATLLTYHYGYPVSEQAVFEEMFARGNQDLIRRDGFSLLDIKNYLARHDFVADAFEFPLAKLLEARLPALVLIVEKGYHHFVVVKGMQDGRVLIGDPSNGTRAMSHDTFEALWSNKLLFVIHNKQEQARFNSLADWRVVPRAPLATGMAADTVPGLAWSKLGPGDY